MGAIIETLTLATILLIVGLAFTLIGMAGLIWKTGYDKRQVEKADKALTSDELEEVALRQSAA